MIPQIKFYFKKYKNISFQGSFKEIQGDPKLFASFSNIVCIYIYIWYFKFQVDYREEYKI